MSAPILLTPSLQAVFLITNFALPVAFGEEVKGQSPIAPIPATEAERKGLGLLKPGKTLMYQTEAADVFLDLSGDEASVWYARGDWAAAPVLLEEMLRKTYQTEELVFGPPGPTPNSKTMTRQIAVGPIGPRRRIALMSMTYGLPAANGDDCMFFVRIWPQEATA